MTWAIQLLGLLRFFPCNDSNFDCGECRLKASAAARITLALTAAKQSKTKQRNVERGKRERGRSRRQGR